MFREQENVSQHEGEPRRRWFNSEAMDLIVWVDEENAPTGFQLSYEASSTEKKILTWLSGSGYTHEGLDEGEDRPFRYKMTPIAVPDGVLDQDEVLERFLAESKEIGNDIREFVAQKLREYPG